MKTKSLGQRPQAGSGHQTDDAGEAIPLCRSAYGVRKIVRGTHSNTSPIRPTSSEVTTPSPPCIMVVADNQSLAAMLEEALASWGYLVCVARNGQEGLMLLATHSVDAILLDLHMQVMNGLTMLDELLWAGYTMPVWVMPGGMEAPALRQLLDEGYRVF